MATVTPDLAGQNGRAAAPVMPPPISRLEALARSDSGVLWMVLPAWLASAVIHTLILIGMFVFAGFGGSDSATPPEDTLVEVKADDADAEKQNFENTDVGLDPEKQTNYNIDRIEEVSVPGPLRPDEPVGIEGAPEGPAQTIPPPAGFAGGQGGGLEATDAGTGQMFGATGGFVGGKTMAGVAFGGRSGATREKMVTEGGGNKASEAAVARGLLWLMAKQKPDGSWPMVEGTNTDTFGATGLALLPFLAAGQTHKTPTDRPTSEVEKRYIATVAKGVAWLKNNQKPDGLLANSGHSKHYAHSIATMALCEAYGMTGDPLLKQPCQRALDYLMKAQHAGGGWRYEPNQAGDTSVSAWCLQALKSGALAGLSVKADTLNRVSVYLTAMQSKNGAAYGYTGPGDKPNLNAAGLLCRQYLGWGTRNPNLIAGVEGLMKIPPKKGGEIYYHYYATQVMRFVGDDIRFRDHWKKWNDGETGKPGMRDILIESQDKTTGPNGGSWPPDNSLSGRSGGRLYQTSLSLLTLEVYYRHLPLYKRDNSGLKDLEN